VGHVSNVPGSIIQLARYLHLGTSETCPTTFSAASQDRWGLRPTVELERPTYE